MVRSNRVAANHGDQESCPSALCVHLHGVLKSGGVKTDEPLRTLLEHNVHGAGMSSAKVWDGGPP